jgi:hypothetical protein
MVSPVKLLVELFGFPLYENKKAVVPEGEVASVVPELSVTGLVIQTLVEVLLLLTPVELKLTVQVCPFFMAAR